MSDQDVVQVKISASVGDFVTGMKSAASVTREAAASIKTELGGIGGAAASARAPMGAFSEIIKDYRKEVRTEGRYARFLAADIASMGLASRGAAGEVTQLVAAFAFGGGIGIAIEGIKMTVKAITELGEAEKRAQEEAKKRAADMNEWADKFRTKIETMVMAIRGASAAEMLFHSEIGPLLSEEADLKQKLIIANTKLAELAEKLDEEGVAFVKKQDALRPFIADVKRLNQELETTKEKLKAANKGVSTVDTEQSKKDAAKAATDAEQIEKQHTLRMLQLDAELLDGVAKLEAEYRAKVAGILARNEPGQAEELDKTKQKLEKDIALYREAALKKAEDEQAAENQRREQELAAEAVLRAKKIQGEEQYQLRLLDLRERHAKAQLSIHSLSINEELEQTKKLEDEKLQIRLDAIHREMEIDRLSEMEKQKLRNEEKIAVAEHAEAMSKIEDDALKKHEQRIRGFVDPMVHSFGDGIKSMIEGTKSLEQTATDLGKALLGSVVSAVEEMVSAWIAATIAQNVFGSSARALAQEQVVHYAGVAGAEAAASQAMIPVIGPILAGEAMAETTALVLSTMLPLASAAGGWDIPSIGMPMLAQLHPSEMVMPQPLADGFRTIIARLNGNSDTGADGGGESGASNVHLHFHGPTDGASVRRFVESYEFATAMREARRNGRLD